MTLNLTRRLVKGTPLTAAEHDGNLDKLEDGIEARELLGAVAAHVAAADPHPGYLTQAEGDGRYRQSATALSDSDIPAGIARDSEVAAAIGAHEAAADPHPGYLTAAEANAAYAGLSDARLSDAREWTAATIEQAEAEAGTATTRRAFTAQRVRQAIAAWWIGASTEAGRAMAQALDATAQRTLLGLGTAAAANTGDFAPASQGVTNGNSHDHNGGDGAQIAYSSLSGLPPVVLSDPTNITGADAVTNIVSLTQAEYDAIATPSATTLYVIAS